MNQDGFLDYKLKSREEQEDQNFDEDNILSFLQKESQQSIEKVLDKVAKRNDGEDEWESVDMDEELMEDVNEEEPKSIEINLDKSSKKEKSQKKRKSPPKMSKKEKMITIGKHKIELLIDIALNMAKNRACDDEIVQAMMLSLLPLEKHNGKLEELVNWFNKLFEIEECISTIQSMNECTPLMLQECINTKKITRIDYAHMLFASLFRSLGYFVRLVVSLGEKDIKKKNKRRKTSSVKMWLEIFVKKTEGRKQKFKKGKTNGKWHYVDCTNNDIHDFSDMKPKDFPSISPCFIVAFGSGGYVRDVTSRYRNVKPLKESVYLKEQFALVKKWFKETLLKISDESTVSSEEKDLLNFEQENFDKLQSLKEQTLPTSQAAYKGHPLYVLEKFVKKFEAIYPRDAPIVGYCGKLPVYSRSNVHLLHTKERWLKDECRRVKDGEQPYKIVKASHFSKNVNTELYGRWQTEEYVPMEAKNGKVPKNERGQVDLFNEKMLPKGTIHLKDYPGIARIAKKLGIDYAPAMLGFEYHGKKSVPKVKGIIVCKEYESVLIDAYIASEQLRYEKETKKKTQRALKNWRKLTLGLLARYNVKQENLQKEEIKCKLSVQIEKI